MKKATFIRLAAVPPFLTELVITETVAQRVVHPWQLGLLILVTGAMSVLILKILEVASEVEAEERENLELRRKIRLLETKK